MVRSVPYPSRVYTMNGPVGEFSGATTGYILPATCDIMAGSLSSAALMSDITVNFMFFFPLICISNCYWFTG